MDYSDWKAWLRKALIAVENGAMVVLQDSVLYRRMYAEFQAEESSLLEAQFIAM